MANYSDKKAWSNEDLISELKYHEERIIGFRLEEDEAHRNGLAESNELAKIKREIKDRMDEGSTENAEAKR